MYIRRCDRCGKEQGVKNLLSFFGGAGKPEDELKPAFAITLVSETREVTLCPACESDLYDWLYGKEGVPIDDETKCCGTCLYHRQMGDGYITCYARKGAPSVEADELCDAWRPE